MAEYLDVLDENGNKTGKTKLRSEVHRDGDWHASVHIWIINDKNEVLLQKRAASKYTYPNMWDISGAGHLSAGDDSRGGAVRELQEELGVDVAEEQLQLLGRLKRKDMPSVKLKDNEFTDVYLLRLSLDVDKAELQLEEVAAIKYVSIDEFKNMVEREDQNLVMCPETFELLFKFFEKTFNKNF